MAAQASKRRADSPAAAPAPWKHACASQLAGGMSTLCFYPLDVVKTRFMAQDGTTLRRHNDMRYGSVRQACRAMVDGEGVRSLFRGAHVAVGASTLSWGIYMFTFRTVEAAVQPWLAPSPAPAPKNWVDARLSASLVGSATGNVFVAFMANPAWLVKNRMQLEEAALANSAAPGTPRRRDGTFWSAALWRGTSAQLLVAVPNAFTFPLYDATKRVLIARSGDAELSPVALGLCSVVAKTAGAVLCHPFVLVKVRLQDPKRAADAVVKYESLAGAFATIARREGVRGFFRGLSPALLQTVPRGVLQFAIYEAAMAPLHRR